MRNLICTIVLLSAFAGLFPAHKSVALAANEPRLTANMHSVQAGQTIDFVGTGFVPQERLSIWVTTSTGAVLSQAYEYSNSAGAVSLGYGVPTEAYAGSWALTAYGDVSQKAAIARFEVIGRPAPQEPKPFVSVSPEKGVIGTYFSFETEGFQNREKVSYWFTGPDNKVYDPHEQEIRADERGRVKFVWQAPEGLPPGRWVVTIQGIRSGTARAISFEIVLPSK